MRGRPPKPAALRVLNDSGTRDRVGHRAIRNEPQPHRGAPARPKILDVEARKEWDRLAPQMVELKLLTQLDRALFTVYCVVWSRWLFCEKVITEQGMTQTSARGIVRIRPETRLALRYAEQLRSIASDFGMSPTSRTRIHVPEAPDDDDELLS